MSDNALIVGSSGIAGSALADVLTSEGWQISGLARNPVEQPAVKCIAADLLDPPRLKEALAETRPSHVFIASWLRQATEAENIRVNAAMVRNLLDALRPAGSVRHVALVTGLKHYLGPFEAYGKGALPQTPFREEQGRLDVENFYYAQEDEVFAAARRDGFTWSVHRPHTVIGKAVGNAMNMGTTLAVYAHASAVRRDVPSGFPARGAVERPDRHDRRPAARRHLFWAATTPAAIEAFNVVNGDSSAGAGCGAGSRVVRPSIRALRRLGPAAGGADGRMTSCGGNLAERKIWRSLTSAASSAWHTDADLGRPIEVVTDMSKSRRSASPATSRRTTPSSTCSSSCDGPTSSLEQVLLVVFASPDLSFPYRSPRW